MRRVSCSLHSWVTAGRAERVWPRFCVLQDATQRLSRTMPLPQLLPHFLLRPTSSLHHLRVRTTLCECLDIIVLFNSNDSLGAFQALPV